MSDYEYDGRYSEQREESPAGAAQIELNIQQRAKRKWENFYRQIRESLFADHSFVEQNTLPFCLYIATTTGLMFPKDLCSSLKNVELQHRLFVTLFNTKNKTFMSTFISPFFSAEPVDDPKQLKRKVVYGLPVYFHVPEGTEGLAAVVECTIAGVSANGTTEYEQSVGWSLIPLDTSSPSSLPDASRAGPGFESVGKPLSCAMYRGTPRALMLLNEPFEGKLGVRPGVSTEYIFYTCEGMEEAKRFVSPFAMLSKYDSVPGLQEPSGEELGAVVRTSSEPISSLRPVHTFPIDLSALSITVPLELEAELLKYVVKAGDLSAKPQISSREIFIGLHNGCSFVNTPSSTRLRVHRGGGGAAVGTTVGSTAGGGGNVTTLKFDGAVSCVGAFEHSLCCIIFQLEYSVRVPVPSETGKQAVQFTERSVVLGSFSLFPFVESQEDGITYVSGPISAPLSTSSTRSFNGKPVFRLPGSAKNAPSDLTLSFTLSFPEQERAASPPQQEPFLSSPMAPRPQVIDASAAGLYRDLKNALAASIMALETQPLPQDLTKVSFGNLPPLADHLGRPIKESPPIPPSSAPTAGGVGGGISPTLDNVIGGVDVGVEEFIIRFVAARPQSTSDYFPDSLSFSTQFYTFPLIHTCSCPVQVNLGDSSWPLTLVPSLRPGATTSFLHSSLDVSSSPYHSISLPTQGTYSYTLSTQPPPSNQISHPATSDSSAPNPLRSGGSRPSCPKLEFRYLVDFSHFCTAHQISQFREYVATKFLCVEIWDASALSVFGCAFVPLSLFVRNGKESVACVAEIDVLEPSDLLCAQGQTLSPQLSPKGKLFVQIACVAHKASEKAISVVPSAPPRAAKSIADQFPQLKAVAVTESKPQPGKKLVDPQRIGAAKKLLQMDHSAAKAPGPPPLDPIQAMERKLQVMRLVQHSLKHADQTISSGGSGSESEKQTPLVSALPVGGSSAPAVPTHIHLFPTLGKPSYFFIEFANPTSTPQQFRISLSGPEIQTVYSDFDLQEMQNEIKKHGIGFTLGTHFRFSHSGRVPRSSPRTLPPLTILSPMPRVAEDDQQEATFILFLNENGKVNVPFKFQKFDVFPSADGRFGEMRSTIEFQCPSNQQSTTYTIHALPQHTPIHIPLSLFLCSSEPCSFSIPLQLLFSDALPNSCRYLGPHHGMDEMWDGWSLTRLSAFSHAVCVDRNVSASVQKKQGFNVLDITIHALPSSSPSPLHFLFFESDSCSTHPLVLKFVVIPLTHVELPRALLSSSGHMTKGAGGSVATAEDIVFFIGQTNPYRMPAREMRRDLVVKYSCPDEDIEILNDGLVDLSQTTEVCLLFHTFHPGKHVYTITSTDVSNGQLLEGYHLGVTYVVPPIGVTKPTKVPLGKAISMKLSFVNFHEVQKKFLFATDSPHLLKFKHNSMVVDPGQKDYMHLKFFPQERPGRADILIFINNEFDTNENCVKLIVDYA